MPIWLVDWQTGMSSPRAAWQTGKSAAGGLTSLRFSRKETQNETHSDFDCARVSSGLGGFVCPSCAGRSADRSRHWRILVGLLRRFRRSELELSLQLSQEQP